MVNCQARLCKSLYFAGSFFIALFHDTVGILGLSLKGVDYRPQLFCASYSSCFLVTKGGSLLLNAVKRHEPNAWCRKPHGNGNTVFHNSRSASSYYFEIFQIYENFRHSKRYIENVRISNTFVISIFHIQSFFFSIIIPFFIIYRKVLDAIDKSSILQFSLL